jgi:hypothetical protein
VLGNRERGSGSKKGTEKRELQKTKAFLGRVGSDSSVRE